MAYHNSERMYVSRLEPVSMATNVLCQRIPLKIHTPPVEDSGRLSYRGSVNLK